MRKQGGERGEGGTCRGLMSKVSNLCVGVEEIIPLPAVSAGNM